MLGLTEMVAEWDAEHEASLSTNTALDQRRPFGRLLDPLSSISAIRFQPYHNDLVQNYMEKLSAWIRSFPEQDRRVAFLVATSTVFVTEAQFRHLQRRLLRHVILRRLLERHHRVPSLALHPVAELPDLAIGMLRESLFVENSDSARKNSFMHANADMLKRSGVSSSDGNPVAFWIENVRVARKAPDERTRQVAVVAQREVVASHESLRGKRRMIVLEDFAGSGSDLLETMEDLSRAGLPLEEVLLAPVVATEHALGVLAEACENQSSADLRFDVLTAYVVPHEARCFGHPRATLLESAGGGLGAGLGSHVERMSEEFFVRNRNRMKLSPSERHGFGGLALAFAHAWNCPDSTLPLIWSPPSGEFAPLFQRASRIL